jgi:hypothetical protein
MKLRSISPLLAFTAVFCIAFVAKTFAEVGAPLFSLAPMAGKLVCFTDLTERSQTKDRAAADNRTEGGNRCVVSCWH